MRKLPEMIGKKYHRWTVTDSIERKNGVAYVKAQCDCGTEKVVSLSHLRGGSSKSCGCLMLEVNLDINKTHGLSHTHAYKIWAGMKTRCLNKSSDAYPDYGGRGIKVCDRWLSFENFFEDMGVPPEGVTLDRINNNGNYELGNCRWATRIEQANNRRGNTILEFNGEIKTLTMWARECGVPRPTLWKRIKRHGWSVDEAITTPVRRKCRSHQKLREIAKRQAA